VFRHFLTPEFCRALYRGVRHVMNAGAVLGFGFILFQPSQGHTPLFHFLAWSTILPIYTLYILHLVLGIFVHPSISGYLTTHALDLLFILPLFTLSFGGVHPTHILVVRQLGHYFHQFLRSGLVANLAESISRNPARLIIWSFSGVIAIGTLLLLLPISISPGHAPSLLTALFTSTSAVCVTGLIVVDTGTYFTPFGQLVILALIQIGALGFMTFSAGVALLLGKRMNLTQSSVLENVLDQSDVQSLRRILASIFGWTLVIEGAGFLILGIRLRMLLDIPWSEALSVGFFHAISAFCNAGFSTFADSLCGFVGDPILNLTVMILIILGGLGFSVLGAATLLLSGGPRRPPNIHVRIVLVTTAVLIVVGTAMILLLEGHSPTMKAMPFGQKVLVSLFQSVTTRTAGFNTIDIGALSTGTLFFMTLLMFIGASPGSTGGGIKTTTFATMLLFLDAKMKSQDDPVVLYRRIPTETVLRAFLITAISAGLVALFTFLLLTTEEKPLMEVLFEVVSAFGTVGLSTGLTGSLTPAGQLLIVCLMFVGRIGPLTLALSIRSQPTLGTIRHPETRVMVG
jgi:trk system potassium uptake protein